MPAAQGIRAGRAFVELFADDSKLVRGLRRAERRIKAFGKRISSLGRKLAGLGAAFATPIALSTRVFTGFDDQMRAVQAVLGATGRQFDRLNEKAKKLGRTTSFTAAQVAGAMLELGRAGFDALQIDASIASVPDLARATGTELPMAANIAAGTLRAFNLEADQMGRGAGNQPHLRRELHRQVGGRHQGPGEHRRRGYRRATPSFQQRRRGDGVQPAREERSRQPVRRNLR